MPRQRVLQRWPQPMRPERRRPRVLRSLPPQRPARRPRRLRRLPRPRRPRSPEPRGPGQGKQEVSSWWVVSRLASERVFASLARADADDLFQRRYENLAVADLAGACGGLDGFDDAVDDRIVDGGFDLHLRQEIDHVFGTAVQLGVAFLAAEAFHLGHRDTLHADGAEGFTNFVKLEGLDDGSHHFHIAPLMVGNGPVISNG